MALNTISKAREKCVSRKFRQNLALSTALASLAFVGYGTRGAHAGSCVLNAGTYECSGAAGVDVTQLLTGFPLNVTTSPGFGINTAAGNAFTLRSGDGLTFTDTNSSAITGAATGIDAYNYDSNTLSITTTGAVTGVAGSGIYIFSYYGGGATQITAAAVTGGTHGIEANHRGSAGLTVSVSGDVTGNGGDGIRAYNSADVASGSMLIEQDAGTTTYGAVNGINADNADGALTINALGTSSGGTGAGIYAVNRETATDLTITANTADGGTYGIDAFNSGSGALSVTTTGQVTGTAGDGILAQNGILSNYGFLYASTGTDLTVTAEAGVNGGQFGIFAQNYGTGALSVTANGPVTGAANDGISAVNSFYSTGDVTVIANDDVTGGGDGIFARNFGTGSMSVTATGTVTGNGDEGIDATNYSYVGDLTVAAASVYGDSFGIRARNLGDGTLNVIATGHVEGTNDDGILAVSGYFSGYGSGLTVDVAAVTGGETGIRAGNFGGGDLSVTASGPVTGANGDGIDAFNYFGGENLTVTTEASVTGNQYGIRAFNLGSGNLSVTASGSVTGTNDDGVYAYNYVSGENLTVQTEALVSGGNGGDGIEAVNLGTGYTKITANGHVQGDDDGIEADNEGTDLTISAVSVTGGEDGIDADNQGATGVLDITVSGAVEGGTGHGIRTQTDAGYSSVITLNAGADVNATSGIAISNNEGDSDTTVNTGASVTGAVQLGDGSDNLTFNGGDFSNVTVLNGGDDTSAADGFVDRLAFKNGSGAVTGANVINWENVVVDMNGTINFTDNTLTTGRLDAVNGGEISMETGAAENFQLTGDLGLASGGGLVLEIFTPSDFDTFDIDGFAEFGAGGEIDFLFDAGFEPLDGLDLTFLTALDGIGGFDLLDFNFIGLDPLFEVFVGLGLQEDELFLSFSRRDPGAVPEPGTLALFGAGLLGLLGYGRNRRRWRNAA